MKTWIVSSLDEETIQGEETNQGRKLYEEIRYVLSLACIISLHNIRTILANSITIRRGFVHGSTVFTQRCTYRIIMFLKTGIYYYKI